jgi:hypothetical protein
VVDCFSASGTCESGFFPRRSKELKSAAFIRTASFFPKRWGKISHTSVHGFLVTQSLQVRRMTHRARPFIEHPTMSVITVKRPFRKRTPDTMVNMTDRRQYRRSLLLRSFRELSRSYFASEKSREFVIEALLFAIIVAISALPIFAAADALYQFL